MSGVYLPTYCPQTKCDPCKSCHWIPSTFTIPSDYKIVDPGHADDGALNQDTTFCGEPFWGMGLKAVTVGAPGDLVSGYIDISILGTGGVFSGEIILTTTATATGICPPFTSPPNGWPPAIPVIYEGVTIFSLNSALGTLTSFADGLSLTGGGSGIANDGRVYQHPSWSGISRLTFANCIMLDAALDQITGLFNCVLPYTGTIPDPVFSIAPTCASSSASGLTLFITQADAGYTLIGAGPGLTWNPGGTPLYTSQGSTLTAPPFYMRVDKLIDPV
jgi:hypothetical protein